ncbi:hypothetical protein [Croceitalea sp. P059]|uniref:DoxX family protein n=1 Tax=Croceitalea sp. P059 TaxID=3075601 RepID=UPI002887BADE|nr:hypothetical protein [Croceitalea sp. P059]MDT0539146.1 hypothetical protein [Croceitalea sp. P059]
MLLTQEYEEEWSIGRKAIFKLVFTYFTLYIFLMFFSSFLEAPFRWFGNILGFNYSYNVSGFGSGDNTYAYITLFVNIVLAIFISLIWILLDRKRKSYNQLMYWFIVILRIFLIFFMFTYGFVKIIQLQFPYPSLTRMMQPLGDFSPMGLAWTYLGYSKGFNLFMGIMEVSGGLLLIPRRTSTLGAFVTMGVMIHVAVMNFMFDIPVKIFSVHLAIIALLIFLTDSKRFINVFVKNKPTEAYDYYNPIKDKVYHNVIFWTKLVLTIVLIGLFLLRGWSNDRGKTSDKPFLHGIWETTEFIKEGDTIPPLTTDKNRWRYLIIDRKDRATVKMMDDKTYRYTFKPDSISKKVALYGPGEEEETPNFTFDFLDDKTLKLKGEIYFNKHEIILKRKNLDSVLLYSRRFNWINETPFNR